MKRAQIAAQFITLLLFAVLTLGASDLLGVLKYGVILLSFAIVFTTKED